MYISPEMAHFLGLPFALAILLFIVVLLLLWVVPRVNKASIKMLDEYEHKFPTGNKP